MGSMRNWLLMVTLVTQVTNLVANVHHIETLDGNNDMGYFSLSLNSTHDPLESLLSGHILSTTPEPAIDWDEVKRVLTTLTKKIAKDNETHVFIFNTLQNYFEFAKSWRPEWANEKIPPMHEMEGHRPDWEPGRIGSHPEGMSWPRPSSPFPGHPSESADLSVSSTTSIFITEGTTSEPTTISPSPFETGGSSTGSSTVTSTSTLPSTSQSTSGSPTTRPPVDWEEVKRVIVSIEGVQPPDDETQHFIVNRLQTYFDFAKPRIHGRGFGKRRQKYEPTSPEPSTSPAEETFSDTDSTTLPTLLEESTTLLTTTSDPESLGVGWIPGMPSSTQAPIEVTYNESLVDQVLSSISSKTAPDAETQTLYLATLTKFCDSAKGKPKWGDKVKKAILGLSPITPTVAQPVNATDWLRYQVKLEVWLRKNLLQAKDSFAHKSSSDYPGSIPNGSDLTKVYSYTQLLYNDTVYWTLLEQECPNGNRVAKLNITGKLSCPKYCSSMLYAAPGAKLKIKFNPQQTKEFMVRIGHWEDDNSGLTTWRQYPNMKTVQRFKFAPKPEETTTEIELPVFFGGIVYIGKINTSITMENITFQISGVVESPSYKWPDMTLLEWREERLQHLAPWGDLISPQLIISYPRRVLLNIDDPEELLIHWERIIDGINEIDATPYKGSREHIAFTRDLPNNSSKMHPGTPLMALEKMGENLTDYSQLWANHSGVMDSFFRNLGRNHESHLSILRLKDGQSIIPELFSDYIKNIVHGVITHQAVRDEYKPENIVKVLQPYLETGLNLEELYSSEAALLFYFDIVRNFGWTTINRLANASRFSVTPPENNRGDLLLTQFSEIQRENLAEYLRSWGIPFSPEAETAVSHLPVSEITAENLLDLAIEQFAAETRKQFGRGFGRKMTKAEKLAILRKSFENDVEGAELLIDLENELSDEEFERLMRLNKEKEALLQEAVTPEAAEIAKRRKLWVRNTNTSDYDQFFKQGLSKDFIRELSGPIRVGQLVAFGPEAFPVLAASIPGKKVPTFAPVIVASRYGSGRILAFSSYSLLFGATTLNTAIKFPYFDTFRINCYMWAGQYDSKNPSSFKPVIAKLQNYMSSSASDIGTFLTATGFPTPIIPAEKINLDQYNLLIIPFALDLTTQFDNYTLHKFVYNGGGLIYVIDTVGCGSNGNCWPKKYEADLRSMGAAKFALNAGIAHLAGWGTSAGYTSKDSAYSTSREFLTNTGFTEASQGILAVDFDHPKMSTIMNTLSQGLKHFNASLRRDMPWIQEVKTKFIAQPALIPTLNATVNRSDALLAKIQRDALIMEMFFDPSDNYSHPSASFFPGNIPPYVDLSVVYNSTIRLDPTPVYDMLTQNGCQDTEKYRSNYNSNSTKISCKDWFCPTHFYAPPGVKVTITFAGSFVQSFSVSTGRFIDVTNNQKWNRYPLIKFEKRFESSTAEISSPFGGPLYIGDIVTPTDTLTVSYSISGVMETPHFFTGTTRLTDWRTHYSKLEAPWGIVSHQNIQIRLPLYSLKLIKNPEELMLTFQHMVDGVDEFHGLKHRKTHHVVNYDSMLTMSGAYMISGKVQAFSSSAVYAVGMDYMWDKIPDGDTFGLLHEFGHNLDFSWWKLNGGAELTNNINVQYVMPTVFGVSKNRGSNQLKKVFEPENIVKVLTAYEATGLDYDRFMPLRAGEVFFYDIHLNFGYTTLFKLIAASKGVSFPDEDFRLDWFFVNLSEILRRNMASYLNSWGLKPAKESVDKVYHPGTNYSMQHLLTQAKLHLSLHWAINNVTQTQPKVLKEFYKIQKEIDSLQGKGMAKIASEVEYAFRYSAIIWRVDRQSDVNKSLATGLANFYNKTKTQVNSTLDKIGIELLKSRELLANASLLADKTVKEAARERKGLTLKPLEAFNKKTVASLTKILAQSGKLTNSTMAKISQELAKGLKDVNSSVLGVREYVTWKIEKTMKNFYLNTDALKKKGIDGVKKNVEVLLAKLGSICVGDTSMVSNFSDFLQPFKKMMTELQEISGVVENTPSKPIQAGRQLVREARKIQGNAKLALKQVEEYLTTVVAAYAEIGKRIEANLTKESEAAWAQEEDDVQTSGKELLKESHSKLNKTMKIVTPQGDKMLKRLEDFADEGIKEIEASFLKLSGVINEGLAVIGQSLKNKAVKLKS